MAQKSILVDPGTGSPVDFSQTNVTQNFRQVVSLGDPGVDGNYAAVVNSAVWVAPQGVTQIQGTITGDTVTNVNAGTIHAIASAETGTVFNGLTALSPLFGSISFSNIGSNTVLASVTGKQIRVLAMNFIIGTAANIYLSDAANGTPLWASVVNSAQFSANSGMVLPFIPVGWFQTSANNGLYMQLSTTSAVGGSFVYVTI